MPELPEVQTIVNDLNIAGLPGSTVRSARVFWPRTIAVPSPECFCRQVKGKKISAVRRRGKFLVYDFSSGQHLLMHLRMSGRLHLVSKNTRRLKHEHVILSLDDGRQLRLHDTRKFGRIYLVENQEEILGRLGPEPLASGFTAAMLGERLNSRKRMLKPLLLDQTFIAGLGNIYVDEALWEAGIHPCRMASNLSKIEVERLQRAIVLVLERGLRNLGTSLGTGKANFYSVAKHRGRNEDELKVFRRTGMQCLRCKSKIQRILVGQRSTHVCPACQAIPVQSGISKDAKTKTKTNTSGVCS
jgi:formamidopyrimidine-DNA glycosylase